MAAKKKLMDVVDELIERGEGKITSLTQLATKLNELDGRQSMTSWRRTLRGYRTRNADDETIGLIAQAFGVQREELPEAADRLTVASLAIRLESLATDLAETARSQAASNRRLKRLEDRVRNHEARPSHGEDRPKDQAK